MNGVFDSTANKKYNDAVPHLDKDDGIDRVECDKDCAYKDTEKNICLFETCVFNQFPLSIPFHSKFTHKCSICSRTFVTEFDEKKGQYILSTFTTMCEDCTKKLKTLILGE